MERLGILHKVTPIIENFLKQWNVFPFFSLRAPIMKTDENRVMKERILECRIPTCHGG